MSVATFIADSIDSAALASATMSRYCPPSTSLRISAHTRCTRRWASGARADWQTFETMSSAQTCARSPSRMAADMPNWSGDPRQSRSRCSAA
ncbi:Uncharacterised protein [Mycobacterium tuberculosis]|nr:Uncharacterised protein [Mycobacterium tuberculosis]SGO43158.1 Uncharacterised protein [Mycobacterium tuberculosis]